MKYDLVDCRTGKKTEYKTQLNIIPFGETLTFCFHAERSSCYCPWDGYNKNHYEGDVCEVFFGTGPDRSLYYEVEISPDNQLFFGRVRHQGIDEKGNPILSIAFIGQKDCFVSSSVIRTRTGYIAQLVLDLTRLENREDFFFNAFRIETDGGQREKHLLACSPTLGSRFHVPGAFIPLKDDRDENM